VLLQVPAPPPPPPRLCILPLASEHGHCALLSSGEAGSHRPAPPALLQGRSLVQSSDKLAEKYWASMRCGLSGRWALGAGRGVCSRPLVGAAVRLSAP
jgi:hypothetical protein